MSPAALRLGASVPGIEDPTLAGAGGDGLHDGMWRRRILPSLRLSLPRTCSSSSSRGSRSTPLRARPSRISRSPCGYGRCSRGRARCHRDVGSRERSAGCHLHRGAGTAGGGRRHLQGARLHAGGDGLCARGAKGLAPADQRLLHGLRGGREHARDPQRAGGFHPRHAHRSAGEGGRAGRLGNPGAPRGRGHRVTPRWNGCHAGGDGHCPAQLGSGHLL